MVYFIACDNQNTDLGYYFELCALDFENYIRGSKEKELVLFKDDQLNEINIELQLTKKGDKSFVFAAYSHGTESALKRNHVSYIEAGVNTHLFSKGLIYSNACLAASELGPDLIAKKAFTYVGYNEEVVVIRNEAIIRLLKHIDNYALFFFLQLGMSIGDAVERTKEYISNIIAEKPPYNKDIVKYNIDKADLLDIRDAMEVVGDKKLTIYDLDPSYTLDTP